MDELQAKFCQKKLKVLEKQRSEYDNVLKETEDQLEALRQRAEQLSTTKETSVATDKLTNDEIARYSRQIILPNFGVKGQLKLKNASVLIVGAGGLGCPSAQHLVGAGIGHIGIVDYDSVEITNLHRQLMHSEEMIGVPKVESLKKSLLKLNSNTKITTFNTQLDSKNACQIISDFDIVLDCTDNVATRYLLNDACVMLKKPLVSGSALQFEGQLTVYNFNGSPCYRCVFPKPPPPNAVTNCGDGGVFATVTGVIGTMQAMEATKIIQGYDNVLAGKLLIYDALETTFRNVKLRGKKNNCDVCGENPSIKELIDYEQFCGMKATDKDSHLSILDSNERVTVEEFNAKYCENDHLLIDVRSKNEFEICQLPHSINVPIKEILDDRKTEDIKKIIDKAQKNPIFVVCRRGNDSQLAVQRLSKIFPDLTFKDINGGLHAWSRNIDPKFPMY
ncbi:adenylyltransferase and sulfurtransferase MOCS3 [Culicoides brevitarsis]|uniref:adenylyltransferase and sulfurtransferase MOCS3 n=1 Tax=Culicoides brevitarsis TaxID=469753 RepID=UPI00307C135F